MIGLRRGDSGDAVTALQAMLRDLGHMNTDQVNGVYDTRTSNAVLAARRSQGSSVANGDSIDGWAYAQIHKALARRFSGAKGDPPTAAQIASAAAAWLNANKDSLKGDPPTAAEVEQAASVWLEANRESLRGPAGRTPEVIAIRAIALDPEDN